MIWQILCLKTTQESVSKHRIQLTKKLSSIYSSALLANLIVVHMRSRIRPNKRKSASRVLQVVSISFSRLYVAMKKEFHHSDATSMNLLKEGHVVQDIEGHARCWARWRWRSCSCSRIYMSTSNVQLPTWVDVHVSISPNCACRAWGDSASWRAALLRELAVHSGIVRI